MRQIAAGRLNSKEEKMQRTDRLAKGFTLIELIFVIAIIVVLASIFVPLALDKLAQANQARADSDLNTIAASLASFFTDVKHMPACDNADCNPITGNRYPGYGVRSVLYRGGHVGCCRQLVGHAREKQCL